MKKVLKIFCFLCSILFLTSCKEKSDTISFEAMDTFMTIRANGKNAKKANLQVQARVENLENLLSVTKENCAVYKINHRKENSVQVEKTISDLITFAVDGANKSNGHFNPVLYPITSAWGFTTKKYTVPEESAIEELMKLTDYKKILLADGTLTLPEGMMFDFGAIGKGFAGDEIIKILKNNGVESAVLDLGGNVQILGGKPDGSNWTVGLKNPWGGDVPIALKLKDCAVITSGGYERYFTGDDGNQYIHIFDGQTGKPVENNVVSSTIVTEKGIYGDYLSTTTFILGKEETVAFWKKYSDFDFIMMFDDHSLCYSEGLKDRILILGDFTSVEMIER